ncbi:MAG: PIN domain-containing protein [Chthoniobacterales bacterium]|nr:PIN domain-containing protein [Chthoniobacterales bacterium]
MAGKIEFIADTSAIIGVLRRDAAIEEKILGKEFAITFVTLAELSLGVLKAARPEAAWSRIQDVIGNCRMFHVSTLTPAVYARIYFDLEQRGAMIPINDIWIAALAIEARLPILARDEHFSRVANLSVIAC